MRVSIVLLLTIILTWISGNASEVFEFKSDSLGVSIQEWQTKHEGERRCETPTTLYFSMVKAKVIGLSTTVAGKQTCVEYYFNVGGDKSTDGLFLINVTVESGWRGAARSLRKPDVSSRLVRLTKMRSRP